MVELAEGLGGSIRNLVSGLSEYAYSKTKLHTVARSNVSVLLHFTMNPSNLICSRMHGSFRTGSPVVVVHAHSKAV